MNVKYLVTKVKTVRAIRPLDHSSIGLFDGLAFFVKANLPPDGVFNFQLEPGTTLFIQTILVFNFILVSLGIKWSAINGQKVGQLDKMNFISKIC